MQDMFTSKMQNKFEKDTRKTSSYRAHKAMLTPTPWPQLQQPNFSIKKN